jgi:O-antigen ligase
VLGYLAETGVVGSVFLLLLLWAALRLGRGMISETRDETEAMWRVGIWSVVFVIVTRYLYEGHLFYSISGMTAVTFFAFLFVIRGNLSRISPVR